MKTCSYLLILALQNPIGDLVGSAQAAEEKPKDMLAAQIRMQGFACDSPVRAVRDTKRSKPDHAVCRAPDMAAKVERMEQPI